LSLVYRPCIMMVRRLKSFQVW